MSTDLWSLVKLGGPVAIVLIIMSVIATVLTLIKIFQFMSQGVGRHGSADAALTKWREGHHDEAISTIATSKSPASTVTAAAMAMLKNPKSRGTAIKDEALRLALDEIRNLRTYLRGIEVIAQTAPLLGLLGTVIGMIDAFNTLETSGSAVNPAQLAGGIWTALLATALGLIIAIIFSIAGAWFESRVENERAKMESLLTGVFASHPSIS
jgi:biopolymer transport protein ExbB